MDRARVTEVQAHPFGRGDDAVLGGDSAGSQFLLRLPANDVVVAVAAIVQMTAAGSEEVHGIEDFVGFRVVRLGALTASVKPGDRGQPARHLEVAQAAGTVFQVWFQMKDGVAEAQMARPRDLGEALHQGVRLAEPQAGEGACGAGVRTKRASPIRRRQSSSEMVNSTLSWSKRAQSSRVRVVGLTRSPMSHISWQRLRTGPLILRNQGFVFRQEEKVDVGVGKQCPAAEAAQGHQGEAGGLGDVLVPEIGGEAVDQLRAALEYGFA